MQIFSTFTITALTLAGFSSARSCAPGYDYCGSSLTNIGNYRDIIGQVLFDNNINGDGYKHMLFTCYGDWTPGEGLVKFKKECGTGRCIDAGSGRDDFCTSSIRGEDVPVWMKEQ